jgi:aminopeptidase N
MGTETALDALLECLKIEPSRARRGVVAALGEFRDEAPANRGAKAAQALEQLLRRGDKSYYVEAEASSSIGKTRSAKAFAALEKQLAKDAHNDVIRALTFTGFAELRDQRALPLAIEWSKYGKSSQVRTMAAMCIGRLGKLIDNKETALDRLTALLDDPDLRVRLAAVAALQELGEDRAVGAISRLADRDLDGRVIRRCREVAARLREGSDKGEEVKKLREELDKLREDHKSMKDRLEKMEARRSNDGAKPSKNGAKPVAKKGKPVAKKPAARGRTNRRRR